MEYNLTSFEVLELDVQLMNSQRKTEKENLWSHLIKIEQLKRETVKKKNAALRQFIQCSKPN